MENCIIVGCGGIGSNLAYFLIRSENPPTRMILIDYDIVTEKNLSRQFFTKSDIGQNKAIALKNNLEQFTAYNIQIDAFPEKNIILTGSSSLDLSNKIGEPLTGRHFTLTLLPLSQGEIEMSSVELKWNLENFLIYGSYPEVLNELDIEKKKKILTELFSSYLFKDALALEAVRSPDMLLNITKCLAFQVGSEVSINEIAKTSGTDVKTVAKYLDLLEKMFIIKKVRGFSRNLRNEISKKAKYYFLDNGIRNSLINQFNDLTDRNDVGQLWENFLAVERLKKQEYKSIHANNYFWRTWEGQEVDWAEERNGVLHGFEFKWGSGKKIKPPKDWAKAYHKTTFEVINRENYLDFLS